MRERDTGVTHNVSVMGDLTTLTLPNVTSSRVDVVLAASTVKGVGSPSPPTSLNLLMTHLTVRERERVSEKACERGSLKEGMCERERLKRYVTGSQEL